MLPWRFVPPRHFSSFARQAGDEYVVRGAGFIALKEQVFRSFIHSIGS